MSRRISPASMALIAIAVGLGAGVSRSREERAPRDAEDVAERMARQQAKRDRRVEAYRLSMIPRDPVPGTKAHRRANKPGRAKR